MVGLPPADLKLQKKFTLLKSQEEGSTLKVWFVSLAGLELGEVLSMRKLRIFHRVEVIQDTMLLAQDDNLEEQQGNAWFEFAQKDEFDRQRPAAAKVSQRDKLPTVENLQNDAAAILEERREKVRAKQASWRGHLGKAGKDLSFIINH